MALISTMISSMYSLKPLILILKNYGKIKKIIVILNSDITGKICIML